MRFVLRAMGTLHYTRLYGCSSRRCVTRVTAEPLAARYQHNRKDTQMRTLSKQKLADGVATRMRHEIERIERVAREKNFAPGGWYK